MTNRTDRLGTASGGLAARLEAINSTIGRREGAPNVELRSILDRLTGKVATDPGEVRPTSLAQALEQAGLTGKAGAPTGDGSGGEDGGPRGLTQGKRPVGAGKRVAMTVRLDKARYQALKALAADKGLSSQKILQTALDAYIDSEQRS